MARIGDPERRRAIGARLKQLRKDAGLTHQQVAEATGLSVAASDKWEAGKAVPSIDALERLGQLYGVTVVYLLTGGTDKPPAQDLAAIMTHLAGRIAKLNELVRDKDGQETIRVAELRDLLDAPEPEVHRP